MADRQGVEVDYCPNCRGVWLDRGELDKIIERTSGFNAPDNDPYYGKSGKYNQHGGYGHGGHGGSHNPNDPYYNKHKKKKGFLDDFFDF